MTHTYIKDWVVTYVIAWHNLYIECPWYKPYKKLAYFHKYLAARQMLSDLSTWKAPE